MGILFIITFFELRLKALGKVYFFIPFGENARTNNGICNIHHFATNNFQTTGMFSSKLDMVDVFTVSSLPLLIGSQLCA
jgi:hypothetical protein